MSMNEAPEPRQAIRVLADDVGLPESVAAFAADQLYPQIENDGGYADAGVPATVYAAVRIHGEPVKPAEIADASGVEANRIMKDMRRMVDGLPFDVSVDGIERRYVDRYVDDLGLSDDFREAAFGLCDDAVDAGLSNGRAPSAFAASVVYAAAVVTDADVEQKDVAEVADVTTTIIRRHYRDVIDASTDAGSTADDLADIVGTIVAGIDGHVPESVREDATEMANAIDPEDGWVRRCDPKAVAAGVVYVAAKRNRLDVTQAEAGDPVGMSRHAVNARSQDVKRWDIRRRLEALNYNRLKELAGSNGIDVGKAPEREYLIDRLAEHGVVP